jgi:capsular exopolysaccharide synthesis family protein
LPKTLVVTSTGPAEGKSITVLALARLFATIGLKVLVVDADMRNPSLHTKLGLDNATGLSNYLTGGCTPPEAFQTTAIKDLAFMASGPLPPNAADLLGTSRLLSLLSVGLEVFDLMVIDAPPVMGLADAQLLSSAAAATVIVVAAGQVRTAQLRGALKRLELARGPVIGAVLTKFDPKSHGYGYGYGYGGNTYGQTVSVADRSRPELTTPQGTG